MSSYPLPDGVRSRHLENVNGLSLHVLEAGQPSADAPRIVLLHGFPELAYSWRKIMPRLAAQGFYVIAPDQRGFGLTTGWEGRYDADIAEFRHLNLVTDIVAMLQALGVTQVAAVVGHDLGAAIASYCVLTRPDLFRSVVLMSAPFAGAPTFDAVAGAGRAAANLDKALSELDPPRKHYQHYFASAQAGADMADIPGGLAAFLRSYFHMKSGDWPENVPFELAARTATELAKLPHYYVMERTRTMAQTVADAQPYASPAWLTDQELDVYVKAYARSGFQGGLQWYRIRTNPEHSAELRLFGGRAIETPAAFISGANDWGIHQTPGALQAMRSKAFSQMRAVHLLPRAGHWVQQEAPDAVVEHLIDFVAANS